MKRHSLLACLLAALLLMGLLGCGTPTAAPEPTAALTAEPTAAPTAPPTPEPPPEPTASPAPAPKIIRFYFDEPDAFAASPDNPLVLSVADDDSDDSGILVSITPKDDAVLSATQADAGETVLRAFWAAYLLPVEQVDAFRQSAVFTVSECERTAIEEAPALRMRYTVQYEDLPLDVLNIRSFPPTATIRSCSATQRRSTGGTMHSSHLPQRSICTLRARRSPWIPAASRATSTIRGWHCTCRTAWWTPVKSRALTGSFATPTRAFPRSPSRGRMLRILPSSTKPWKR